MHIRTTFITGFPGESEEDFEELADFAEETKFERLGVLSQDSSKASRCAGRAVSLREKRRPRSANASGPRNRKLLK